MKTLIFLLLLAPAASLAQNFERIEADLMAQINERRAEKRRKPLTYEIKHQEATDKWAIKISTDPINGRSTQHSSSVHWEGEVIGNFLVPELIIEQFFDSEGHRAALMNKEAVRVTISVYLTPAKEFVDKKGWTVSQPPLYNVVIRTYRESTSARGL